MAPTAVIQSHGEPAHPAVIPWGLRDGPSLAHLALIAQATGAVMTLHHPGVDLPRAQPGQDGLAPRFPIEGTHCKPLHPSLLIGLFPLPIGPAVRPAEDR